MRFRSTSSHTETLADGREVGPYGECEMSKEQYQNPEQWRRLSDGAFIGLSAAADKVISDAKEEPDKYDHSASQPVETPGDDEEGGKA